MKKYEGYTSYASLWNTSFPNHWNVLPLYALAKEKSICNSENLPLLSVYLDMGVIPFSKKTEKRTNVTSIDLSKYQRVDIGDFVLNNQQAWRGSVGISFYTGIVSPAYIVLSMNNQIYSRYANYLLRSQIMVAQYLLNSKSVGSIQRNLYWTALKRIRVPVPPRDEQEQIVRFLEWKVSAINRLINLRRKEITALEDLKRSIIHHAVTHGIKPNIPMKDSGVQWIGKIPNHWKLLRNKNIFREAKELVGTHSDKYPLLSLTTKGIILRDVESGKGKFPKDFETYKIVSKGDMAFCLFDIDETPRTVGLSSYDGMLTGAYSIFHVSNVNPRYVYYYYLSVDDVKSLRPLYSGLRKTINTNTFLGIKFPYPPQDEQEQIVQFLDQKVIKVDETIKNKEQQVEELNALKARLISDVVTGKIDVRGVEVPEYETVEKETGEEETVLAEEEANEQA